MPPRCARSLRTWPRTTEPHQQVTTAETNLVRTPTTSITIIARISHIALGFSGLVRRIRDAKNLLDDRFFQSFSCLMVLYCLTQFDRAMDRFTLPQRGWRAAKMASDGRMVRCESKA
jgi:hypothetical protein